MRAQREAGDSRTLDVFLLQSIGIGLILVLPSFIGWTQFYPYSPNPLSSYSFFERIYVSSPFGLDTGPWGIGWLLNIFLATGFIVGCILFDRRPAEEQGQFVVFQTIILVLYGVLFLSQVDQIQNMMIQGSCSGSAGCPHGGQYFVAPSGLRLTYFNDGLGWGAGSSLLALIFAIIFFAKNRDKHNYFLILWRGTSTSESRDLITAWVHNVFEYSGSPSDELLVLRNGNADQKKIRERSTFVRRDQVFKSDYSDSGKNLGDEPSEEFDEEG